MSGPAYRVLRIVLRVFSLLAAIGGLFMILADKPLVVRVFLRPPEGEVSTSSCHSSRKWVASRSLASLLLWLAARNPVRNVAIVDALIVGLCILSVTPLLSLWGTDIRSIYPAYLLWGRSVVRLAIAALLYWLKPRETRWEPVGDF